MATKSQSQATPMTEFNKLTTNSKLSEVQHYSVVKVKGNQVEVKNEDGTSIILDKGYVESCLVSSDQYRKEETITRTELAALFLANADVVMTVNFNTKIDAKEVTKEVMEAYQNTVPAKIEAAVAKAVKKGLEGEARTMIGRHYGSLNEFGRVSFIDMAATKDASKTYDTRTRQADPRGLNWMILKGVKYSVK
jgi:hypothetical protein